MANWTTPVTSRSQTESKSAVKNRITFLPDRMWALETLTVVEGESVVLNCTFTGATSLSAGTLKAYRKKNDVTSTVFPSGSSTATGNVLTLPPLTGLVGNNRYVVSVQASIDGGSDVRIKKFMVICLRDEDLK